MTDQDTRNQTERSQAQPAPIQTEDLDSLQKMFVVLRAQTGHDFSLYKKNTVRRRLERRMAVRQLEQVRDYVAYLGHNPAEVRILFKELLIGVTGFFRDEAAFVALEQQVIPRLFDDRHSNQPVRIWTPGCATGEEAYCLAMLLQEQLDARQKSFKIQLFATDIDEQALEQARLGLYPPNIVKDVSAGRLQRFFSKTEEGYQVSEPLRKMIVFAAEYLQTAVEELESSNEEIKSTNEELQSANEELETSQEETQSINEELVALNAELEKKVDELTWVNNDINNLLTSIDVGLIFLDRRLNIRRFNRAATAVINLIETDLDRPLRDIASRLAQVDWVGEARTVFETLAPRELEVQAGANRWYLMRLRPYRTLENAIEGVVITLTDITQHKEKQAMRAARDLAENIVDAVRQPLLVLAGDLRVVSANRAFYQFFRLEPEMTAGKFIYELDARQWDLPRLRAWLADVETNQTAGEAFEVEYAFPEIGLRSLQLVARPVKAAAGQPALILVAIDGGEVFPGAGDRPPAGPN